MSENKNISQDVVAHMAQLSRLAVSDEEKALFARQFGDILAYMDVLAQVDTSAVEPLYSPVSHATPMRDDQPVRTCWATLPNMMKTISSCRASSKGDAS